MLGLIPIWGKGNNGTESERKGNDNVTLQCTTTPIAVGL